MVSGEALKEFGNLSGVLSAPAEELMKIRGIGPKNALYLGLVHQVAGRYLKDRISGKMFFRFFSGCFRLSFSFHAGSEKRSVQSPFPDTQE